MRDQIARIMYLYHMAIDHQSECEAKLVQETAVDAILHETQQPTVTPIISAESPVGDGWIHLTDMDLKNYRTPCSKEEQQ